MRSILPVSLLALSALQVSVLLAFPQGGSTPPGFPSVPQIQTPGQKPDTSPEDRQREKIEQEMANFLNWICKADYNVAACHSRVAPARNFARLLLPTHQADDEPGADQKQFGSRKIGTNLVEYPLTEGAGEPLFGTKQH